MEQHKTVDAEVLTPGLTRKRLHDHKIVVFEFTDIKRDTLDKWEKAVAYEVATWEKGKPFLNLHNWLEVKPAMSFTPYVREKASNLTKLGPDLAGRTALVLPKSIVVRIVNMFLRVTQNKVRPRQIFYNYDDAVKWLEDGM